MTAEDAPAVPAAASAIRLEHIDKSHGEVRVLQDVSLDIADGEFFTLLGPSGSGKTTLLRIIAGLLEPDGGELLIGSESMRGRPAYARDLGVVFQSLALFPHLSVGANVEFPLRMRRLGRKEIAARVRDALELVQLPDIQARRVGELSGGQLQRVALARALVYQPRILLLDEPLSALDRRLREIMQLELTRIHRELGVTIVNVTHDQREALMVSDRIAVMDAGRIVQCAPGPDLYASPASVFVAGFLGDPLLLDGHVSTTNGSRTLTNSSVTITVVASAPLGDAVAVMRPERLRLLGCAEPIAGRIYDNQLHGTVEFSAFDGSGIFYQVRLDCGVTATVHVPAREDARVRNVDERVVVAWNAADVPVVAKT
jgi:putative spermidine/putrescine transport system ATP-binding protein